MTDGELTTFRTKLESLEKELTEQIIKIEKSRALTKWAKNRRSDQKAAVEKIRDAVLNLRDKIKNGEVKSEEEQKAALDALKDIEKKMNQNGMNVNRPILTTLRQMFNKGVATNVTSKHPVWYGIAKIAVPIAIGALASVALPAVGLGAIGASFVEAGSLASTLVGLATFRGVAHAVVGAYRKRVLKGTGGNYDVEYPNYPNFRGWLNAYRLNRTKKRTAGKVFKSMEKEIKKFSPLTPDKPTEPELSEEEKAYNKEIEKVLADVLTLDVSKKEDVEAFKVLYDAINSRYDSSWKVPKLEQFKLVGKYLDLVLKTHDKTIDADYYAKLEDLLKTADLDDETKEFIGKLAPNLKTLIASAGITDTKIDDIFKGYEGALSEEEVKLNEDIDKFIASIETADLSNEATVDKLIGDYNTLKGRIGSYSIAKPELFKAVEDYLKLAKKVHGGTIDDALRTELETFLKADGLSAETKAFIGKLAPKLKTLIDAKGIKDPKVDDFFKDSDDDKEMSPEKFNEMLNNLTDSIFKGSLTPENIETLALNVANLRLIGAKKGYPISAEMNAKLDLCDKYLSIVRRINNKSFDEEFYNDFEKFVRDDTVEFRSIKDHMLYEIKNLAIMELGIKNPRLNRIMDLGDGLRKENSYGATEKQRKLLNDLANFDFAAMNLDNYRKARELSDDIQREIRMGGDIYLDIDSKLELAELDSYIAAYTAKSQIAKCINTCKGVMDGSLALTSDEAKQDAFDTCIKYYHDIIGYTGLVVARTNDGEGAKKTAVSTAIYRHLLTAEDLTALRDIMKYYKDNYGMSRKGSYLDEEIDAYSESTGRSR